MTRQVESRTLEAIQQIERFEQQPSAFREQLCAHEFKRDSVPLTWKSAVLSRSGLGSAKAWTALDAPHGKIAALNPMLLRAAVARLVADPSKTLLDLLDIASRLLQELVADSAKGWHEQRLSVFGTEIRLPKLDLESRKVAARRLEMADGLGCCGVRLYHPAVPSGRI